MAFGFWGWFVWVFLEGMVKHDLDTVSLLKGNQAIVIASVQQLKCI